MLSQAVLAHYESLPTDRSHGFSITSISPCPYETFLNFHNIDSEAREPTAVERLRMKNGHWQEQEVLADLKEAGFELRNTGNNQLTVHIGKSQIPGHPDGLIRVNVWDLLEIKAMSINWYTLFKEKGLSAFPRYRTQVQLYMASDELLDLGIERTWEYVKHKDTCRPVDIEELRDLAYSQPIIEATDEIVLNKWEPPKPTEFTPYCHTCRHRLYCFKDIVLDTSEIKVVSIPEVVEKWKEGKFYLDLGKKLVSETRTVFKEKLGDSELMLVEDLKIQKIHSKRSEVDISKFVEIFGANRLPEIMVETLVEQMRINIITEV